MSFPGNPGELMEVGGGRRLAICPEALYVETRGPGGVWLRSRAIPFAEIRAIYRYEVRDWSALALAGLAWLGVLVLVLMIARLGSWPGGLTAAVLALTAVVVGGLGAYRMATAPKRLLRIDAYSGGLVVPNRVPGFYASIAARLPGPSPTAPPEPAVAPPAPGEWRVEGLEPESETSAGDR
ncbi:MAG TPA: hypothetical protein VFU47_10685 [Armatimonadota bacterium]|nr:hypothetical protein [Armatimonadota bacterium]